MDAAVILAQHGFRIEPGTKPGTWKIIANLSGAVHSDNLSIAEVAEFAALRASGMQPGCGVRMS